MKRQRRTITQTNRRVKIVLQVGMKRNGDFDAVKIGSIQSPVILSDKPIELYSIWVLGDGGKPVKVYSHEYKEQPKEPIKRVRNKKPEKVIRRRTKKVKRGRIR